MQGVQMKHSHHLRKHRQSSPNLYYAITTVTHGRVPLFRDFNTARLVINHLNQHDAEGITETLCYVLMPDHLHWMFKLKDKLALSQTVKRLKGRTAIHINQYLKRQGSVWQKDYFEHQIRCEKDLLNQARYIIANPLRAGLVESVKEYPHWDCIYL